jgi:hypothetical protein
MRVNDASAFRRASSRAYRHPKFAGSLHLVEAKDERCSVIPTNKNPSRSMAF